MSTPPPPPGVVFPPGPQQWQPPARYQPPPPPVAPNGQPLASFGDRVLAYIIDYAILAVFSLLLIVPIMVWWVSEASSLTQQQLPTDELVPGESPPAPDLGPFFTLFVSFLLWMLAYMVLSVAFTYLYWVELQKRWGGQTVGKRVMKLRVVPVDPAQSALGRGGYTVRWAVEFLVGMAVPLFNLIDGLWQVWDKPLQQCLHDKAANTLVVKVG